MENQKVVILCGGRGTRINEETSFRPKPLIPIGEVPILWHIMKIYSHYGYKDFVLCLGYKGELIKEFFINLEWKINDIKLNSRKGRAFNVHKNLEHDDWNITFVDTGLESLTGLRLKKIENHIDTDNFFVTYGDGLADINIKELLNFHINKQKIATLTAINPPSRFGILEIDHQTDVVSSFREKIATSDWVNGGFFVFKKNIFDYLEGDTMFEMTTLPKLSNQNQLAAYKHKTFWQCMDTYRDYKYLNEIWNSGKVPWKFGKI